MTQTLTIKQRDQALRESAPGPSGGLLRKGLPRRLTKSKIYFGVKTPTSTPGLRNQENSIEVTLDDGRTCFGPEVIMRHIMPNYITSRHTRVFAGESCERNDDENEEEDQEDPDEDMDDDDVDDDPAEEGEDGLGDESEVGTDEDFEASEDAGEASAETAETAEGLESAEGVGDVMGGVEEAGDAAELLETMVETLEALEALADLETVLTWLAIIAFL